MLTLTLDAPLTSREPQVLLDPTLKPGGYLVTLVVSGGGAASARAQMRFKVVVPTLRPSIVGRVDTPAGVPPLTPPSPPATPPATAPATPSAIAPAIGTAPAPAIRPIARPPTPRRPRKPPGPGDPG